MLIIRHSLSRVFFFLIKKKRGFCDVAKVAIIQKNI